MEYLPPISTPPEDQTGASGLSEDQSAVKPSVGTSNYRWTILGVSFISQMAFSFSLAFISPLGPFLKTDLGISLTQFGLLTTAQYFGTMVLLVVTGWAVDQFGVRYVMLIGQVGIGLFLAVASWTNAPWQLLLVLFLAGLGNSASGPTTAKAIVTWFSAQSRATAMGIKQAAVPIAGVIAGLILPVVATTLGWRPALTMLALAIAALGVFSFILYRDAEGSKATTKISLKANFDGIRSGVLTRDIVILSVGAAFLLGVQFAITNYFVIYLRDVFSTSVTFADPVIVAGWFFSVIQIGGVAGRIGWGVWSDRKLGGRRKDLLTVLAGGTFVFCLGVAFFSQQIGLFPLAILAFFLGLFGIGWTGLHLSLVSELAGLRKAGAATGVTLMICYVGMMVVPPLFGFVTDVTHSYTWAWVVLAVLALISASFIHFVKENHQAA